MEQDTGPIAYGMVQATNLLNAYVTIGWICHLDVSSALVIASLQKEGKSIEAILWVIKDKDD